MTQSLKNRETILSAYEYYEKISFSQSHFYQYIHKFLSNFLHYDKNFTLEKSYSYKSGKYCLARGGFFFGDVETYDITCILRTLHSIAEHYQLETIQVHDYLKKFVQYPCRDNYMGVWFEYHSETDFRCKIYFWMPKYEDDLHADHGNQLFQKTASYFIRWFDLYTNGKIDKKIYYDVPKSAIQSYKKEYHEFFGEEVLALIEEASKVVFAYKRDVQLLSIDFFVKNNPILRKKLIEKIGSKGILWDLNHEEIRYISVVYDREKHVLLFDNINIYYE